MHKLIISFVFSFLYILGLTSWIRTMPSIEGLKFESPSKWNSYEGFNFDRWMKLVKGGKGRAGKRDSGGGCLLACQLKLLFVGSCPLPGCEGGQCAWLPWTETARTCCFTQTIITGREGSFACLRATVLISRPSNRNTTHNTTYRKSSEHSFH